MSSNCVEVIPHSCGSSRLQVFQKDDGTYNGYCFGCGTYVHNPYEDMPSDYKPKSSRKSAEDIQKDIDEISEYQTVNLLDRKLSAESLAHFGIKIGLDQTNGTTPVSHHYPYYNKSGDLIAYKNRIIEGKKMWSVGNMKEAMPFGWHTAISTGSPKLFITEGEIDAVSLYGMIKNYQKDKDYALPAVISLSKGAAHAASEISKHKSEIDKRFKEVVLVFDQDEAGEKATEEVLKIAPEYLSVELPAKDPNDCLVKGHKKATATACLFNASVNKNTSIVWGSALHEAGRQEAEWGVSWPWEGLTELTRGIRTKETYYIGAGVKMGKSEVVNALAAWFISEHGWKCFMAKPEEANRKTYQMVVGKIANRIFHDPKIPFDYDAYDEASPKVADNLAMIDLYQHLGWDSLKGDIRYAALQGCKAIFIDPITNLTVGMDTGKANEKLQEIAVELSSMAADLDVAIFIFCHLKAPEGTPHERGGKVLSTQLAGSRAMMRSCNYALGLEGNKDPDLPADERNLRRLVILEDREFGATGGIDLFWNPNTGSFTEV